MLTWHRRDDTCAVSVTTLDDEGVASHRWVDIPRVVFELREDTPLALASPPVVKVWEPDYYDEDGTPVLVC